MGTRRELSAKTAPFSRDGSLQHYPHVEHVDKGNGTVDSFLPQWRANGPFRATLAVHETSTGRSAPVFIMRDSAGRTYPVFVVDMLGIIQSLTLVKGTVNALWIVQKRGNNYGLRLATTEEAQGYA